VRVLEGIDNVQVAAGADSFRAAGVIEASLTWVKNKTKIEIEDEKLVSVHMQTDFQTVF
jgi:hypothetical protein